MLCLDLEERARYVLILDHFTYQITPLSRNMCVLENGAVDISEQRYSKAAANLLSKNQLVTATS
jgi:hypothetical protein